MDEYIMRQAVLDAYEEEQRKNGPWRFETLIESVPAADVVPVVRCRECKHFNLETHECENEALSTDHEGGASYSLNFYDDDFCSFGERSTD